MRFSEAVHPDQLSPNARAWLERGSRTPFFNDADRLREFVDSTEASATEELIEFELTWGGWSCDGSTIGFVEQTVTGELIEGVVYDKVPGRYLFQCTMQSWEQYWTLLAPDGRVFDWVGGEDEPFESSSSFIRLLESRVLFRELYKYPEWYSLALRTDMPDGELAQYLGLAACTEANDRFESWYLGEHLRLHRRGHHAIWHDLQPTLWLHVLDRTGELRCSHLKDLVEPVFKRDLQRNIAVSLVNGNELSRNAWARRGASKSSDG